MARCVYRKSSGQQCKHQGREGDYCQLHAGIVREREMQAKLAAGEQERSDAGGDEEGWEYEDEPAVPETPVEDPAYAAMNRGQDEFIASLKRERPLESEGVRPAPRRQPVTAAPEKPPVSPELVAEYMVQQLLRQEAQMRMNPAKRPGERDSRSQYEGMRTPDSEPTVNRAFRVVPRRKLYDETVVIDPTTGKAPTSLVPGYDVRHVRTRDQHDRPIASRVAELESYGYECVRDAEGEVIESRYGVVMQGPPEARASRTFDLTPAGSMKRDEALYQAGDIADDVNRLMNERVAGVVVGPEHQHQPVMVGYDGKQVPI